MPARTSPIPTHARLERLYQGTTFSEGPAADAAGNVYFSDCQENRIHLYKPVTGKTEIWREPSGRANGMNFDAQGRLVTCCDGKDGGASAVWRYEHDGSVSVLATHYQGKKLNSPNDLCFDHQGNIYFTDPRYGYKHDVEQDCMAVYRIGTDRAITRVIDDLETPNGILLTPDNNTMYLVDNNPDPGGARTLLEYHKDGTGAWRQGKVLHDFGTGRGGDGMVLDIEGNIYLTAGADDLAGVYIFTPNGEQLGFIRTGEAPGNCTFGGKGLQTLYITATSSLYAIELAIPGQLTYPPRPMLS